MLAQLFERVKNILISPAKEWSKISKENNDLVKLLINYVLPLAAIPAIALLLGYTLLAIFQGFPLGSFLLWGLIYGIVMVVLYVVLLVLAALFTNILAPSFSGKDDFNKSFALVAYSATPMFVAGIFYLLIALSSWGQAGLGNLLTLLGLLYGMYILYLGIGPMKGVPKDKVLPFFIVVVLIFIVLQVVLSIVLAPALVGALGGGGEMAAAAALGSLLKMM